MIHCRCNRCFQQFTVKIGPEYTSNPIETCLRRADHRSPEECIRVLMAKIHRVEVDRAGTLRNMEKVSKEAEHYKRLLQKERCHRRSMSETWGGPVTGS